MLATVLMTLATAFVSAQTASDLAPYLFRLEHGNAYSRDCVLLQKSGSYHLELEDVDNIKIFEGSLKPDELQQVLNNLKTLVEALSQGQIEEPLVGHSELLKLDVARHGRWSEVRFLSVESQEPYRQSLQPMIRWLNNLHKSPHKELSEDAGKNNCLVPRKIVLKKRDEPSLRASSDVASRYAPAPSQPDAPPRAPRPLALLRVDSFGTKSDVFHSDCVLIAEDGSYRAENRSQKSGRKTIDTRLNGGQLTPTELAELQQLLSNSALADIRHRKTSHMELPVSGEMLELKIARPSGLQEIVLSSTFNRRDIPFFYSGDGDIANARPLLKFLSEHINNNGLGSLDPQLRNGCTDAP
jgi:hypothetical protein